MVLRSSLYLKSCSWPAVVFEIGKDLELRQLGKEYLELLPLVDKQFVSKRGSTSNCCHRRNRLEQLQLGSREKSTWS